MTWHNIAIAFAGGVAWYLFDRVRGAIARRYLGKSEVIRRNVIHKIDTAALPELAKAVEAEMVRRSKMLGARNVA